jgi:hypothetical protein
MRQTELGARSRELQEADRHRPRRESVPSSAGSERLIIASHCRMLDRISTALNENAS